MDYSIPPSYTEATNRDWLPLLGPYLTSASLLSATRVSTKWQKILAPSLWRNPTSHFTTEHDRIYTALTKFIRILPETRVETRRLTHTLYLPPAPAELYGAPQNEWLREVLDTLPGLRCLVVARIPFFDHAALLALRRGSISGSGSAFQLKLLIASGCINCTPVSLGAGLVGIPNLVVLDVSWTPAAREENVLRAFGLLLQLQILKLRRIGLRDADLRVLADALNPGLPVGGIRSGRAYRLRSLDLRDNFLTDDSVKVVIARFIHPDPKIHGSRRVHGRGVSVQDWHTTPRPHIYSQFRGPDLDKQFIRALTRPEQGQIYLEDLESVGLTHLYLANNKISMEALVGLIRTQNLYVLDAGDIDYNSLNIQSRSSSSLNSSTYDAGRLIPSFESEGWDTLTYLRINHKVVTAPAGRLTQSKKPNNSVELQVSGVSELDREEPGSSGTAKLQYLSFSEHEDQAPEYEPVPTLKKKIAHETRADIPLPAYRPQEFFLLPVTQTNDQDQSEASRKILQLINNRQELRSGLRNEQRGLLLPGRIPAIQTLALTEVPSLTQSTELIQNIKDFITNCATEHHLATEQAQLEESATRTLGTSRKEAIQSRTKQLFALHTIILEITPPREPFPSPFSSPFPSSSKSNPTPKSRSSVNDRDAETLWAAAENDFSFFNDEKCSIIISPLPKTSLNEKETQEPSRDVVAEIARWRVDRRKEHQAAVAVDAPCGSHVAGFWPGDVKILRPASHRDEHEHEHGNEDLDGYRRLFGQGGV